MKTSIRSIFLASLLTVSVVPTTSKSIDWPVDITTGEVAGYIAASFLTVGGCRLVRHALPLMSEYPPTRIMETIFLIWPTFLISLNFVPIAHMARNERIKEKRLRNEELVRPLKDVITLDFVSELTRIQKITRDYELYLKGEITLENMIQTQGFASNYEYPLTEYINALPIYESPKPNFSLFYSNVADNHPLLNQMVEKLEYRLKYLQQEIEAAVPGRSKHDVSVISLEDVQKQKATVQKYIDLISQLQNVLAECKKELLKTDMYAQEVDHRNKCELQNALGKVNQEFKGIM